MIVFGIVIGAVILAGIVFMALNKKSNPAVRTASLIALAAMVLAVIICIYMGLLGVEEPHDESIVLVPPPVEVPKGNQSLMLFLFFVALLVIFFAWVAVVSLRKNRKKLM